MKRDSVTAFKLMFSVIAPHDDMSFPPIVRATEEHVEISNGVMVERNRCI